MHRLIKPLFIVLFLVSAYATAEYNNEIQFTQILKTDRTTIGQKFNFPNPDKSEVTIAKVTIPPGAETGWHRHHFPVFAYVEKGTLTVEVDNRKTMQFSEGSSFAEVIQTYHNGRNTGKQDVLLLVVYLGEKGEPLSVKKIESDTL